ncbi:hypothetical protein [[Clostridium] innocuum]|uniref:hypothetical protein n=1 Tax=Clostridium innocuum TaxID=1522 RepID=UPI001916FEF3|nr:hypothetical protein [[Clostridium] innocuum]WAK79352.1 hypothetical protein [Clostridium phage Amboise]MCI2980671.1 hypothetical protein [[Clostridium] innocuum]MCI3026975.1 hypothetical protein [[Clostridium] innocuum]MCR0193544.1 hypothetical protein [[Clostridium] innocuum]MCR0281107.1 hypothetical protein [[Clostridium] innocuum]
MKKSYQLKKPVKRVLWLTATVLLGAFVFTTNRALLISWLAVLLLATLSIDF